MQITLKQWENRKQSIHQLKIHKTIKSVMGQFLAQINTHGEVI